MIIKPKEILLKDGRKAILRSPRVEEASALLELITTICGETDFLLRTKEEFETMTVESEMTFIDKCLDDPDMFFLVCEVDGKLVGDCDVHFEKRYKTKHRAIIGIGILKDYWNLGIGSAFFDEMTAKAKRREGVSILELEFVEGNARARALYEKQGFKIVGIHPKAILSADGTPKALYIMQKEIR